MISRTKELSRPRDLKKADQVEGEGECWRRVRRKWRAFVVVVLKNHCPSRTPGLLALPGPRVLPLSGYSRVCRQDAGREGLVRRPGGDLGDRPGPCRFAGRFIEPVVTRGSPRRRRGS